MARPLSGLDTTKSRLRCYSLRDCKCFLENENKEIRFDEDTFVARCCNCALQLITDSFDVDSYVDAVSLFTNVLLIETIDISCNV